MSNVFQNILNWFKRHKIISFVFCFCIFILFFNTLNFAFNSIKYGYFSLIAKYPKLPIICNYHGGAKLVRVDNENVLLFQYEDKNKCYCVYNFNLRKRKFKKLSTTFDIGEISFAEKMNGKIYLVFNKLTSKENKKIFIYDYENDRIESNLNVGFAYHPIKIKYKNKDCLAYEKFESSVQNNIPKSSLFIYDGKRAEKVQPEVAFLRGRGGVFGQTEDGKLVFCQEISGKKANGVLWKINILDLYNKKMTSETFDFDSKYMPINFIWLGENKFIVAYELESAYFSVLDTFEIKNGKDIVKIASLKIKKRGIIIKYPMFSGETYVVLNPKKVVFSSGFITFSIPFKNSKNTLVYDYEENKLTKITDFPYKTSVIELLRMDDSTFLAYKTSIFDFWVNGIYKFKLRKI